MYGIKLARKLKRRNKKIVVTGGIFDILHIGHIRFLRKAKEEGDLLFVLLEPDSRAKKEKGENRPINKQKERAEVLSSLSFVDYVININDLFSNKDYDKLIYSLKPDIIALTKGSSTKLHAKRQAKETGAKVLEIIPRIRNKSTTRIAKIISESH